MNQQAIESPKQFFQLNLQAYEQQNCQDINGYELNQDSQKINFISSQQLMSSSKKISDLIQPKIAALRLKLLIFVFLIIAVFIIILTSLIFSIKSQMQKSNPIKRQNAVNLQMGGEQLSKMDEEKSSMTTQNDIQKATRAHKQSYSHQANLDHTHSKYQFLYQTLGISKIGQNFNFTQVLSKDYRQYQQRLNQYLQPYQNANCDYKYFGDQYDKGYVLCNNFLNQSDALVNIGIEGRDLFGCSITSQFLIPNYQFDCFNENHPHCSTNYGLNEMQKFCISDLTETTLRNRFISLKDLIDIYGLTTKQIILKMDIQGAQWSALRTLPISYLSNINQMIIQFHNPGRQIQFKSFWGNLQIAKTLNQLFINVNYHMNNQACYSEMQKDQHYLKAFAFQVTLVNKKLLKLDENSIKSYEINSVNKKNSHLNDCQMQD